jgi:hypothetical protein
MGIKILLTRSASPAANLKNAADGAQDSLNEFNAEAEWACGFRF